MTSAEPLRFRRATEKDARAISQMMRRNAQKMLAPHYSAAQLAAFLRYYSAAELRKKIVEEDFFCAYRGRFLAGTISLRDTVMVRFYVSLRELGKGVGRALLAHLEAFAREKGISEISLTASPAATGFYLKHGFETVKLVDMVFMGEVFEETLMVKKLTRTDCKSST